MCECWRGWKCLHHWMLNAGIGWLSSDTEREEALCDWTLQPRPVEVLEREGTD